MPENREEQLQQYEALRAQSRKMKKRIVLVLICAVAIFASFVAIIRLVEYFEKDELPSLDEIYEFYPVYEGDILENREYLGLDRMMQYCDDPSGYGITQSVVPENFDDFDANVLFLYQYVQTIINGDADAYNACFNETYYRDVAPVSNFSQQMLYNIRLRYDTEENGEDGSKLVTYRLEYMIHRNDGTFRRDVGSDASRAQFVTLRISAQGDILIEKLVTVVEGIKQ